jgi:hypothetical protein
MLVGSGHPVGHFAGIVPATRGRRGPSPPGPPLPSSLLPLENSVGPSEPNDIHRSRNELNVFHPSTSGQSVRSPSATECFAPLRSVQSSFEGPGQACSVKSPMQPIRRSRSTATRSRNNSFELPEAASPRLPEVARMGTNEDRRSAHAHVARGEPASSVWQCATGSGWGTGVLTHSKINVLPLRNESYENPLFRPLDMLRTAHFARI